MRDDVGVFLEHGVDVVDTLTLL